VVSRIHNGGVHTHSFGELNMTVSFQPRHPYYKIMMDLKDSIEDCVAKGRTLPCLTLVYSAIDVFAGLEAQPGESTKKAFVRWAETYMLKNHSFSCSALDLYAARCGIIHSFSAGSALSRSGQARKIIYAWGTAEASKLERTAQILGRDELTIHVRDLIDAFGLAVINHVEDVSRHPDRHQHFLEAAGHWLASIPSEVVDKFLDSQIPPPSQS
jgi:hypothetical protein